jgi:aldehyde:ferredoxin oxidoreductase
VELSEGKYAGVKVKDLEITPVVSFGATVGLGTEAIIKACELCQRYGLDMVSTGGVLGFAIELYKQGIINEEDLGFELDFGDDEAAFKLLHMIINREGIWDILAEGSKRAAEQFPQADRYAIQIKGLEIPMIDPRRRWSTWTLGMLTNRRGGDHLRCRNPVENLRFNERDEEYSKEKFGFKRPMYEKLDMPEEVKQKAIDLEQDTTDIPVMAKWAEDLINLFNSVGICIRPPVMEKVGPTIIAEACQAFTGIEFTPAELMESAERTWNLIRLFNLREGEKAEASKFPRRFYEEELHGQVLDEEKVQKVLEKYYQVRGWDPKPGDRKGKLWSVCNWSSPVNSEKMGMKMKRIFVNAEACTGCGLCQLLCSVHKTGQWHPALARIKIKEMPELELNVPVLCLHCSNPPCEVYCVMNLIYKDTNTGYTLRREDMCIGCRLVR